MIVDSRTDRPTRDYEFCIVGAGPVGISLALDLSDRGRDVLLLESGGDGVEPDVQALSDADMVDARTHDPMDIAVARRFGGTSTLWGGRCLPYDAIDFVARPVLPDPAWPIDVDTIAPYVARACAYAHCGAPVFSLPVSDPAPGDGRFTFSALERWSAQPRFHNTYRRRIAASRTLDMRLHATVVGFVPRPEAGIEALDVALSDGTRTQVRARHFILCAGGVETARLLLALQRLRPSSLGGTDGPLGRTYMGHLIGEIADIKIRDPEVDRALDFFIDEHGTYVRRRFVPNAEIQRAERLTNIAFWPVVPPIADAAHRSGPLSLIALALSTSLAGRGLVPEAIRRRHIPDDMARRPHVVNVLRDVSGVVMGLPSVLKRRYLSRPRCPGLFLRNPQRRYGLSYHAEHLPHRDSRIRLTDKRDRLGLPRVEIDLKFRDEDVEPIVRAHALFAEWLEASGVGRLAYRQDPRDNAAAVMAQARHGTHQIGLARMAATEADGVVDRDLTCFGFDNLHVASSAVLPTSGQANPTLTTIALALRLADRLAQS